MEPSNTHYPHECKHCNADGVHCDKTIEPAGEYTWVYPCHLLEYPCQDFTPKMPEETIEEAMQKAWCEYRNMEYVPGFVNPLPSDNFEKAYLYGRRDGLTYDPSDRVKINGIILDGKVYVAVERGSRHCSDCDLYLECNAKWLKSMKLLCEPIADNKRVLLNFSPELTDKINRK